jgi:hypothetical protein
MLIAAYTRALSQHHSTAKKPHPYHFGIDQGPVVLMVENYRTGLLWDITRRCSPVLTGLRRAGFAGGWL